MPIIRSDRRTELVVVALASLGIFTIYIQIGAMTASLSVIGNELNASTSDLQWIFDCFTIPMAALVLSFGMAGERWGKKRLITIGLALSFFGNVLSAFSNDALQMMASRAIAGIGSAAVLTNTLAFISSTISDRHRRSRATSYWALSLTLGLAVGPFIAGGMILHFSWRTLFVPLALMSLATLAGVQLLLREDPLNRGRSLDPCGQILAIVGVSAIIFGLIRGGEHGWMSPDVGIAFVTAVVASILFYLVEKRSAFPLLELKLFASPRFFTAAIVGIIAMASLIGMNFVLSIYFGSMQHCTPIEIAVRFMCFYLPVVVTGQIAGWMIPNYGVRAVLVPGLLITGISMLTLVGIYPTSAFQDVAWRMALTGVGFGLVLSTITAAALDGMHAEKISMAAGSINACRQLGAAIGPAVLGTILMTSTISRLPVWEEGAQEGHNIAALLKSEGFSVLANYSTSSAEYAVLADAVSRALHICVALSSAGMFAAAILTLVVIRREQFGGGN